MKRSIDNVENLQSESQGAPKRANTNTTTELEEDNAKEDFGLLSKNRALWIELSKNKRSLNEARKELEMMRKKTREMESLVSVIQRAWSQLDIDTSLLLDGLADPDVKIPSPHSQLLKDFIHSADVYLYQDPTNLNPFPQIQADQWSNKEEIIKATDAAIEMIPKLCSNDDTISEQHSPQKNAQDALLSSRSNKINVFGEQIEDHLVNHISFTFSILERLCYALSDGATLTENHLETLKTLQVLKESRAKESLLSDGIVKLETDLYMIESKLRIAENQKTRVEKQLDKAYFTIKELEEKLAAMRSASSFIENQVIIGVKMESVGESQAMNGEVHELQRQIALLETQLAESESVKAEAEMHLTERISRPLMQADAQVSDMRKAMEDLRAQCKQRVNHLLSENELLYQKVKDLQLALAQVETAASKKIEDFIFSIEKEFNMLKQEKQSLELKIKQLDSTVDSEQQSKALLQEYQQLEDSKNLRLGSLENESKSLQEVNQQLSRNLEKSRKRERYLESVISHFAIPLPSNAKPKTPSSIPPLVIAHAVSSTPTPFLKSEGEDLSSDAGFSDSDGKLKLDQISHQMIKQTQERCSDLEKELNQVKTQVNDLITEIEAVSNHEAVAREQSEGLIKRIAESHSMQQMALDENLKLMNDLEDTKVKKTDAETKMELMKSVLTERDKLISQLRLEEFNLMNELTSIRKSLKDLEENKNCEKERAEELQQKLDDLKVKLQDTSKRNQDLQARCNELSKQCQRERKLRLEEQRKDKRSNLKREPSITEETVTTSNQHDTDMLEMTLGMLRCSVCKDRFKSATIKKCFHLFCRECIDENIRSRLRKCPACGEKFGQDDVANIYFTN